METFPAYWMTALGEGSVTHISADALPPLPLAVRVEYSDLNYKDALAVTGKGPILRGYPIVPGIDLAGVVVEDASGKFKPGDKVWPLATESAR